MKVFLILISLFLTFNSFCQEVSFKKSSDTPNYSEHSAVKVFYSAKSNKFHADQKPVGFFVDGQFIGSEEALRYINSDKIENIKIEKEEFEINGMAYYGKILIQMKSDYIPNFLTLQEVSTKHLKLNENPIIYQIDEKVIDSHKNEILIDEHFILKIVVEEVKTSEKNTVINLIRMTTKTAKNIEKANEIRIKGIVNNGYE